MGSTPEMKEPLKFFLCYAQEDDAMRIELEKHLSMLRRSGSVSAWYDREIETTDAWKVEINKSLNTAQIILLLVSADFIASDYCYGAEMRQALQRHITGNARVIPIILRPVDLSETPFHLLQALPKDGRPITNWTNRDKALLDVVKGIRSVVENFKKPELQQDEKSSYNTLTDLTKTDPFSPISNIPYHRNPFFTGREDVLKLLYEALIKSKTSSSAQNNLKILMGSGGMGKTQIAVEYAYRYSRSYQTILWANAATRTGLIADFAAMAMSLKLPEKDVQDQNRTVAAVQHWMVEHKDWLLVLDNADNLDVVREFVPFSSKGHILLTTQAVNVGNEQQRVIVDRMKLEDGVLFLLRRIKRIGSNFRLESVAVNEHKVAKEIVENLGGLALALDLAGFYIEKTKYDLSNYLELYKSRRERMRTRQQKELSGYLEVATVWSLILEEVNKANPAMMEALYLSAFLYPDAIPREIMIKEFPYLWQNAITKSLNDSQRKEETTFEELYNPSLTNSYTGTQAFSIHSLVQIVLKDMLNEQEQLQWAERSVKAIWQVFPHAEPTTWKTCQIYLPHVQASAVYIEHWNMKFIEAVQLLLRASYYLKERGQYRLAELLGKQALEIQEETWGANHLEISESLSNLAEIYYSQGKYIQSESLYQRVLTLRKRNLGPNAPEVAQILNNLAAIYNDQGRYVDAETFFRQALNIRRQILGIQHPDVAESLNDLGLLYAMQGKYEEAEKFFAEALIIRKRALKDDDLDVATSLNNLATVYSDQGKYEKAEEMLQEAMRIDKKKKVDGKNHPNMARDLNNLGGVLEAKGELLSAQEYYEQALSIDEKIYGPDHPNVAGDISNIGSVLRKIGDLKGASVCYEQALAVDQKIYGLDHPNVAVRLNNLGSILQEQGQLAEAQELYKQALSIVETSHKQSDPKVASIFSNLASIYHINGDLERAQVFYERALTMGQATYGPKNLNVGNIVIRLGDILQEMGDVASAQVYYKQALEIFKEHLGENHSYVKYMKESLADVAGEDK